MTTRISDILSLSAGNTVSLFGYQNSGGAINTDASSGYLSLIWVSNA